MNHDLIVYMQRAEQRIATLEAENTNLRGVLSAMADTLEADGRFPHTVKCIRDGLRDSEWMVKE